MHPRYLAIGALLLLAAAGLLAVLLGLQQGFMIGYHERYAAEGRVKAMELQRSGQLEQARRAEEDAARDQRYAAEGRRNRLLSVSIGGAVAGLSVAGVVVLFVFPDLGRASTGRFDAFLQALVMPQLRPHERVLHTGFVFEGELRRPITYCAALTNQRLLLLQTDTTLFLGRPIYRGQEEIDLASIGHCTTGGVGFHRELTLVFRDGSTRNLRLNMLAGVVSGQEAFLAELPQKLGNRGVAI
jgi:hypothetical protein